MDFAHELVRAIGRATRGVHAGTDKLASRRIARSMWPALPVMSPAFLSGGPLPLRSTADGAGQPPPLMWGPPPRGTRAFIVVVEDPDVSFTHPFVHWIVYGIPAAARGVDPATLESFTQGKNGRREIGFAPAAPPPGHGLHHYHFQVFALDTDVALEPHLGRPAVVDYMRGHVRAWGEIVGTYERD